VTFLFSDIEGSTQMASALGRDFFSDLLQAHRSILRDAFGRHQGREIRTEGDSFFVAFASPREALAAAVEGQLGLSAHSWPEHAAVRVRIGLHTGEASVRGADYEGIEVHRAARIAAAAHGGQVLVSGTTRALVQDDLPSGVAIRDLGENTLKGLPRPERLYQVTIDGLRADFPALGTLAATPTNLPIQLTELIGRHVELAEAEQLFTRTRLLTILGPGGAGKTRLAIQMAADVTASFPDGVFFISLADISSSRDIVQAVAESLGVALSSDDDVKTQLLTYLMTKCQLLLFDNFDHLIDTASIVTGILQAAPQVKVLVTSRAKLNVTGETVFTLAGLETTWASPDEAFQTSGVRLFIDAAKRVRRGFVLEPEDLHPVAEILRLIGGLPLGILLAAAWVDMLALSEIAAEIAKNLDFLETETGDAPDRHRSLRAVFDYSYALLSHDERQTFLALSAFRGGFTRQAAQAVAGASLRGLSTLVSKSLIAPSPQTGRYAVHELLRQYAEAELRQDMEPSRNVDEAHAAFYAALMEESLALFIASDQPRALRVVEQDLDNVRSAWRYYLAAGNAAAARPFIEGLWYLYEIRGWYMAGISLFGEALEALPARSDEDEVLKLRALAAAVQAWFMSLVGQSEAGEAAARNATDTLHGSLDFDARITAAQCLAVSLAYLGRMEEMAACTEEAIALADAGNHPLLWPAAMRTWRSFGAVLAGDIATAESLLPESYEVLLGLDEHYMMSWNLWVQAMIATQQGRPQDAVDLHTRQVARCRDIGYMRGTMVALEGLGDANFTAGRFEAAEQAFIEGMVTADKMGMVKDMLGMMAKIAKARAAAGHPAEAVELLAAVLAEPISAQQPFTANTPIMDVAAAALDELRDALGPDEYSTALARGASTPFEVAAKELMTASVE
jgi:predicted ATPase/class 3 adenylate cyclase